LEVGDGRGTGVEVLWSDTTIVIVVLMAEGNDSGRGGQAVEGAGGEVGKHHGAEAKLVAAKAAPEDGQSGPSARRHLADEEEDGRFGRWSSSWRPVSGQGLGPCSAATRVHEGQLGGACCGGSPAATPGTAKST
jgi:hypothetical protein